VFDLEGRVALVTGAGQNVGAGIAQCLASQGAAVAVNDLVPERAAEVTESIQMTGAKSHACPFDVTQAEAVHQGIRDIESALGPVDILINNAGVPPAMGLHPFREMPQEEWDRFIALNMYGVMQCSRAVLDGMCERKWGRLITISSGAGQVGLSMGVSLYGAAKSGAIGFMRHLAMEVAHCGVTANSLALGLMEHTLQGQEAGLESIVRQVPVGRLGTAHEVGAAVVYLASNEASWLTGQTIGLNGGATTS
jgi:NAD(P)-dependent dehydrogenase (short-subunit alcohol dehydrogenase family)